MQDENNKNENRSNRNNNTAKEDTAPDVEWGKKDISPDTQNKTQNQRKKK